MKISPNLNLKQTNISSAEEKSPPLQTIVNTMLDFSHYLDYINMVNDRDVKWLNDENRQLHEKKLASQHKENQEAGNIEHVCLYEFPRLPPVGKAVFSEEERRNRLSQITQTGLKDNFPGGCSTVLRLLEDHFFFLCRNLKTDILKLKLQKKDLNSLEILPDFYLKCRFAFGQLICLEEIGNLWTRPIAFKTHQEVPDYQEVLLKFVNIAKTHSFLSSNKNMPTIKKFLDMFALIGDIVTQDPGLLVTPLLTAKIDLSRHFDRLMERSLHLKEAFSIFTENNSSIFGSKYKDQYPEDIELLKDCEKYIHDFHKSLKDMLSEVATEQGREELYQLLLQANIDQSDFHFKKDPLRKILTLIEQDDSRQACLGIIEPALSYTLYHLYRTKVSIVEEGILACFAAQLSCRPDYSEADACLNNVVLSLEEIQSQSSELIEHKFDRLDQQELNNEESKYLIELYSMWHSLKKITKTIVQFNIDLLNYHLKKCKEPNADHVQRAQAIKDLHVEFGITVVVTIKRQIDALTQNRRTFYNQPVQDIRFEIHELSEMLFERLQMLFEVCNGIDSQIKLLMEPKALSPTVLTEVSAPKRVGKKKKSSKRNTPKRENQHLQERLPEPDMSNAENNRGNPSTEIHEVSSASPESKPNDRLPFSSMRESIKTLHSARFLDSDTQRFFSANLRIIKHVIRQLEETVSHHAFSLDKIFGETDSIRRLLEGVLGLAVIASTSEADLHRSLIDEIQTYGHSLISFVKYIRHSDNAPENLKKVVLQNWDIPAYLSKANACVNYLHTTREKTLSPQAALLSAFLSLTESEALGKHPNPTRQKNLLEAHQNHAALALTFASELLHALADPDFEPESKEPPNIAALDKELEALQPGNIHPEQLENEDVEAALSNNIPVSAKASMRRICNRRDALDAVENALIWLHIRSLHQVEGQNEKTQRKKDRNLAFKHVSLYLSRLKEKLAKDNYTHLYNTIIDEMKLMRRAHKELNIAYLYHGDFFIDGKHIVEAENMRCDNNPCRVNRILRRYSSQAEFLPDLNEGIYKWMSQAHQWLTYPEKQWPWSISKQDPWIKQVKGIIRTTRDLSRQNRAANEEKHLSALEKTQTFVVTKEEEIIFTSLSALLHTIIYGMPIRGQTIHETALLYKTHHGASEIA